MGVPPPARGIFAHAIKLHRIQNWKSIFLNPISDKTAEINTKF